MIPYFRKAFIILICATVLGPIQSYGQDIGHQTRENFKKTTERTYSTEFLLSLPKGYESSKESYPMILFLHGAGERGENIDRVAVHGPPKLAHKLDILSGFIIVSPQCPKGERWVASDLIKLVEHIEGAYRVDETRIYVTGLSMGGFGTWSLISKYPGKFAAAAPICGGGDPINIMLADSAKKAEMASLPIWNFHGTDDTVVHPMRSDVMVEAIIKIQGDIKYTLYPGVGHDSWSVTYANEELYQWFLKHQK